MRGVISITDWDWFQFLSTQPDLDEANFWRPTDLGRPRMPPGTPFIFKLKKKHGSWIVGFGIFAAHVIQPMWLAWEEFEQKHGAETFDNFQRMLAPIRRAKGKDADPSGSYDIGCILLAAPVFFPRDSWILPPSDWKDQIVQDRGYDLETGEGARLGAVPGSGSGDRVAEWRAGARESVLGAAARQGDAGPSANGARDLPRGRH